MQAPNLAQEVAQITKQKATLPFPTEEARLAFLVEVLIPDLNRIPGMDRRWGKLVKTEQNNKVPADIIVWRDTMEHFDVLTDTGPMWHNHGSVTNPNWVWAEAAEENIPQPPPTNGDTDSGSGTTAPDGPNVSDALNQLRTQVEHLSLQVKVLTEYETQKGAAIAEVLTALLHRADNPPTYSGKILNMRFKLDPEFPG